MSSNISEIDNKYVSQICACGDEGCATIHLTSNRTDSQAFSWRKLGHFLTSNERFRFLVISITVVLFGLIVEGVLDNSLRFFLWTATIIGLIVPSKLAIRSLKKYTLTINTLLVVATLSALVIGLYEEAIILVVVFSLGEILEGVLVRFTERNFDNLRNFLPSTTTRIGSDGETENITVEDVKKHDNLLIKTGEKVPVDGIVIENRVEIQKSHLTGESSIEVVEPQNHIYAGSLVVSGATTIRTTVDGKNSKINHIIQSVEKSLEKRSSAEQFSQKFGKYYTPIVFLVFLVVSFIFPLFDNYNVMKWFLRGLVILVVSCACGLAVSVPVTFLSAISAAASRSILIRGGAVIEKSSGIKTIVFDKTGTLTHGIPIINNIEFISGQEDRTILAKALTLTIRSNHPVSKSIRHYLIQLGIEPATGLNDFTEVAGEGVRGRFEDTSLSIERDLEQRFAEVISSKYGAAASYNLLRVDDKTVARFIFKDEIRSKAKEVVQNLKQHGYRVVMISGDNTMTTKYVAEELEIDEFSAEVHPEGKSNLINSLKSKYGPIIMVGDGINDAPALVEADIGFAMGLAGADLTSDIADVVLIQDDLEMILQTLQHSKHSFRIAKMNIILALVTVLTLLLLAILGILDLVSGIIANELSALLIIGNGLRPLRSI